MIDTEKEIKEIHKQMKVLRKRLLHLKRRKFTHTGNMNILNSEREIIKKICKKHNIHIDEITGTSQYIAEVKTELALIFRGKGYTLKRIAFLLGYSNHCGPAYLLKKCKQDVKRI